MPLKDLAFPVGLARQPLKRNAGLAEHRLPESVSNRRSGIPALTVSD